MPAPTTDAILNDLRHHGLLSPGEWSALLSTSSRARLQSNLGQVLSERGWLTRYQIDVALRGQAERLVFGPYILLDRVAEGGMGVVYRARHSRLGRTVALKVIRSDKLKSKVVARRFLREIRLTASLEHPNIVRAYDAGVVGDQLFLATEFIEGRDLGTLVRQSGLFSQAEACRAVYQTALALQHIHEQGMIHRDLKPSNLIRDNTTGTNKLLDLGLCGVPHEGGCFDSQAGMITRNGVLLGTPDYIAPEQAQDPHGVDIRADLYSLGCTFYYLLTGRPPFAGGSAVDKLIKHLHESPPPIRMPSGEVSPAIAALIARLMAKRPEDRFPAPRLVAETLLNLQISAPTGIDTPPPAEGITNPFLQLAIPETSVEVKETGPHPRDAPRGRKWSWIAGGVGMCVISIGLLAGAISAMRLKPGPVLEDPPPKPMKTKISAHSASPSPTISVTKLKAGQ